MEISSVSEVIFDVAKTSTVKTRERTITTNLRRICTRQICNELKL